MIQVIKKQSNVILNVRLIKILPLKFYLNSCVCIDFEVFFVLYLPSMNFPANTESHRTGFLLSVT